MSVVSSESRRIKQNIQQIPETGKLPTSLLKQAMASEKIQEKFEEIRKTSESLVKEDAPSLELLLEHELSEAYNETLQEDVPQANSQDDQLLKSALNAEAACQSLIEDALADHLDTRLGKFPEDAISDIGKKTDPVNALTQKQHDNAPAPVSLNDVIEDDGDDDSEAIYSLPSLLNKGKTVAIVGAAALTMAAGVFVIKSLDFDRLEIAASKVLKNTVENGTQLAALVNSGFSEEPVSAAVIYDEPTKQALAAKETDPEKTQVANLAPAPAQTVTEIAPSSDQFAAGVNPANLENPSAKLDQSSIMESRLKSSLADLGRLEQLLAESNQQKKQQLNALIKAKRAEIEKIEGSLGTSAKIAAVSAPTDQIATASAPETATEIEAAIPESSVTTTVSNVPSQSEANSVETNGAEQQLASIPALQPEPESPPQQPAMNADEFVARFQQSFALQEMTGQQQIQLAGKLAEGECIVPALTGVFDHVPVLVMRDLVKSLPDHC